MELIILVGLLVILPGAFLVYRGFRGRPVLSEPTCAKCGYDVRSVALRGEKTCPECGADLTGPSAVKFGRPRKRPAMIWTGVALLLLAMLFVGGPIGIAMMGIRWDDLRSNESIIANLKTTADQPWDWQRLQRRAQAGKLSREETAQAIDQLIAHLQAQKQPGPLHWSDDFVRLADSRGDISPEQLTRFAQAYYGPLTLKARPRVRQGRRFAFEIRSAQHFELTGVYPVFALKSLTLDGKPVSARSRMETYGEDANQLSGNSDWGLEAFFPVEVAPGEHELVFDLDVGVTGSQVSTFEHNKPGQKKHWPSPRATWTQTIRLPIAVVPADTSAIEIVTDPKLDPIKTGHIKFERAEVVMRNNRPQLRVVLIQTGSSPVPMAGSFVVRVAGKEYGNSGSGSSSRNSVSVETYTYNIPDLPNPVGPIDVIWQPSIEAAEQSAHYERVWGVASSFPAVPVTRDERDPPAEEVAGDEP
jgi:hypothetical protein